MTYLTIEILIESENNLIIAYKDMDQFDSLLNKQVHVSGLRGRHLRPPFL